MKTMTNRTANRIAKAVRAFVENAGGVAAVEFAYMVPLLLLATFGTLEVARGVLMHKRFQRASAMVGDLIAREKDLGTDQASAILEIDGIMKSAEHAMKPFSAATLKIGVMSIRAKSNDATSTKIEWSRAYHGKSVPAQCATKAMPASGMITQGNAAIIVESEYTYQPILANLIPGFKTNMTWTDTITHSPRNSCVNYAGQNCVLACPGW
jgi:Flp pilus assembly protein TadG